MDPRSTARRSEIGRDPRVVEQVTVPSMPWRRRAKMARIRPSRGELVAIRMAFIQHCGLWRRNDGYWGTLIDQHTASLEIRPHEGAGIYALAGTSGNSDVVPKPSLRELALPLRSDRAALGSAQEDGALGPRAPSAPRAPRQQGSSARQREMDRDSQRILYGVR